MNQFVSDVFPFKSPSFYYVRLDAEGNYLYVNDFFQQTFRDLCPDFVGKNYSQFVHPDDMELCLKAGEEMVSTRTVSAITLRKLNTMGSIFHTHWNFFIEKEVGGIPVEVGCIGFDISPFVHESGEKKLTEQKLEAVLKGTTETFYLLDTNMKMIAFSNGAQNVAKLNFGLDLYEGFDFTKLLVPKTKGEFMEQFASSLAGETTFTEDKITFPNGNEVWFKLTMSPAKNAAGEIYGVALNFNNIDVLKRSEMQLKEIAWEQSHTVRKPLSNILGLVEIMKDENDYGKMQELFKLLQQSARELDDKVKEIVSKTAL